MSGQRIERLSDSFPIFGLGYADQLPELWAAKIADCTQRHGEAQFLDGRSATSRQRQLGVLPGAVVSVNVVTGKVVATELGWLCDLYRDNVHRLANSLGLGEFVTSPDERSAVNLNVIPRGSQYEWHVDTNPLTGLLFVTSHPSGDGGELVFRPDPVACPGEDWEFVVTPRAGDLLLFDGRRAAHTVYPVRGTRDRITVPMNFYLAGSGLSRPDDLDAYLYGEPTRPPNPQLRS